jgi:hypothetical protein
VRKLYERLNGLVSKWFLFLVQLDRILNYIVSTIRKLWDASAMFKNRRVGALKVGLRNLINSGTWYWRVCAQKEANTIIYFYHLPIREGNIKTPKHYSYRSRKFNRRVGLIRANKTKKGSCTNPANETGRAIHQPTEICPTDNAKYPVEANTNTNLYLESKD